MEKGEWRIGKGKSRRQNEEGGMEKGEEMDGRGGVVR